MVKVETDGGTIFEGDIVVGADGVHSRVAQEMQRLAGEDIPGKKLFQQENGK
jgi:2-polyprenyl-6-methoxyphenol hydroxylase-like FAD-dependent oxidoreductase